MRKARRQYKARARRFLRDLEEAGYIRWTGDWHKGEKVYETTPEGRAWALETSGARDEGTP